MTPARVSIVTATYNRSQVLRHSIASVVAQRFTDWELVVVGDACTDDTEAVTASFGDPRIRFHNLPRNVGEQSGPNNTGIGMAMGELLAFLNHDDLWFSDHLEHLVAGLERTGADLVFPLMANVIPRHPPVLSNFSPSGSYDPRLVVPASGWLFRRQLWTRVGPWPSARQCYQAPSQDWLLRAWKAGARLQMIPMLTAIALPSGYRRGSYTTRDDSEHAAYAARLRHDPGLREQLLLDMALGQASAAEYSLSGFATGRYLRRGTKNVIRSAVAKLGIPPAVVSLWLKSRRKGHFIDTLRQARGLPPLPRERTR